MMKSLLYFCMAICLSVLSSGCFVTKLTPKVGYGAFFMEDGNTTNASLGARYEPDLLNRIGIGLNGDYYRDLSDDGGTNIFVVSADGVLHLSGDKDRGIYLGPYIGYGFGNDVNYLSYGGKLGYVLNLPGPIGIDLHTEQGYGGIGNEGIEGRVNVWHARVYGGLKLTF